MRLARLAAAFAGMALVSGSAQAALTFSTEVVPFTSGTTNFDRVILYALSDAASTGNAKNVLGGQLTVQSTVANALKFSVSDTDEDGTPDTVNYLQNPVTGATRTRADTNVFNLIAAMAPDPRAGGSAALFAPGVSIFAIDAAASNGTGYLADSTVNGGKGYALFAAVVPQGAGNTVTFSGSVGDGTQAIYPISLVPEPTSLAFLGLAGAGLLGRRRRQA